MLANEMMKLKQDLHHFGLDPQDWKLVRQDPRHIRIESLIDENFVFLGRVFKKDSQISWDQIQLAQI